MWGHSYDGKFGRNKKKQEEQEVSVWTAAISGFVKVLIASGHGSKLIQPDNEGDVSLTLKVDNTLESEPHVYARFVP